MDYPLDFGDDMVVVISGNFKQFKECMYKMGYDYRDRQFVNICHDMDLHRLLEVKGLIQVVKTGTYQTRLTPKVQSILNRVGVKKTRHI